MLARPVPRLGHLSPEEISLRLPPSIRCAASYDQEHWFAELLRSDKVSSAAIVAVIRLRSAIYVRNQPKTVCGGGHTGDWSDC